MHFTCAALILHHNNRQLLPRVLDSLIAQEGLDAICVIDNASTDDSVVYLQAHYPKVEIIQNKENLPFGTAYNCAICQRTEDIILILNNDVIVHPGAVAHALGFLEKNPDVASVSFEGLDPKRGDQPFPSSCLPLKRFGKQLAPSRYFAHAHDEPVVCPCYLWGAACCIRREVFMQVQFDTDMDWYFEDIDLGWAITRQTGMKNVFLPSATMYHLESATSKTRFQKKQWHRMITRNALITFAKNGTAFDLLRAAPYFLYHLICRADRVALTQLLWRKFWTRPPSAVNANKRCIPVSSVNS